MRTAYFSAKRRPGVVFRVSTILALVPSIDLTNLAVRVAMPERCPRKFNAVRSEVKMVRTEALISAMVSPGLNLFPSCLSQDISLSGSVWRKHSVAKS